MKRLWIYILVLLLVMGIPLTAAAQELAGCVISADTVIGAAGEIVTVPVRITGNPGFTNFAVALDYDREQLTLVEFVLPDGEAGYLSGEAVSVNPAWQGTDGREYGYVVWASSEKIREDGILFAVRFRVSDTFTGNGAVTPVIQLLRNQTAVLPVFEEVAVTAEPGGIVKQLSGDYDGDRKITLNDVNGLIDVYRSKTQLAEELLKAVDMNGDGRITLDDVNSLIDVYRTKSWMTE